MNRQAFPTPFAGTYYPIYSSGANRYIPPTPDMPFGPPPPAIRRPV